MTATLLPFPTRAARPGFPPPLSLPKPRTVTLLTLEGAPFASAGFLPGDPGAPWAWIQSLVAAEWGVEEDAVGTLESEEDGDCITVDGLPMYRVALPCASVPEMGAAGFPGLE